MATKNPEPPICVDPERESEKARADVIRRAVAQGVKAFSSLEDLAGDPEITADIDLDDFLRQVSEDRERPSIRSVE